jgi:hypothetical protein
MTRNHEMRLNAKRTQQLIDRHDRLWSDPRRCERLVSFAFSDTPGFDMRRGFTEPDTMLDYCLAQLQQVMETDDDSLPTIRVEMGTGLIASAFGAEIHLDEKAWPAVTTHPIDSREALEKRRQPDPLKDGWFEKAYRFITHFRKHMPEGVFLSQCDMQGPWNSAHLIAGDKIFLDIYDDPSFVAAALDRVTDLMIRAIPPMKQAIGEEENRCYLHGLRFPGGSRVCNCSTDMISPEFYEDVLFQRDNRYLQTIGGGLMHICGSRAHCIPLFNRIPTLHALEINFNYLDVFRVCEQLRPDIVLLCTGPVDPPLQTPLGFRTLEKFIAGEFPDKRNIFFHFDDPATPEKWCRLRDAVRAANR